MGKLTDKVAKGLFWVLMEKFGLQTVHFVVTLVLARLLTPNDYGTVALLSIFIAISNVLVDSGFGKALVQKKNATQVDYNSVFYLSMAVAGVLYGVLFAVSPWVAEFYRIPELKIMLRVLALSLIFHSINGVQNVELNRKMLFHLGFRISWVSAVVKAVVGVAMAYCGYGPWALVWASLSGGLVGVVARQMVIRWRPTLAFSWSSVCELYRFGWKVAASSLLDKVYSNIQALAVGKVYTRADLAFVNKGRHLPNLLSSATTDSLRRVSFSALSRFQDEPVKLRNAMRRMIKCSTFCVFPLLVTLAILAHPIVKLLWGNQWVPCVPYLQIVCFSVCLRQFDVVNLQGIMARGRSDIVMKLTVIRRLLSLIVMAATLRQGVFVFILVSNLVVVPLGVVMNAFPNRKHLSYTLKMQFNDVSETVLLSLVLGVLLWGSTLLPVNELILLPFQVVLAGLVYGTMALAFRVSPVREIAKALCPLATRKLGTGGRVVNFLRGLSVERGRA